MGTILLWIVLGVVGVVCILGVLKLLHRLLLRAEEKGWIYYRKKSAGGIISGAIGGAMKRLDEFVRPSAEYRAQAEEPVVEEDEKGGD